MFIYNVLLLAIRRKLLAVILYIQLVPFYEILPIFLLPRISYLTHRMLQLVQL